MEPVIKFLNRVKDEVDDARKADADPNEQPFHRLIAKAKEASAVDRLLLEKQHDFEMPTKTDGSGSATKTTTSIQYDMDKQRVKAAKRELGVRANWQVGEETFEYWWRAKFD